MVDQAQSSGARWTSLAASLGGLPLGIQMQGRRRNLLPEDILSDSTCNTTFSGGAWLGPGNHRQLPGFAVWVFEVRRGECFRLEMTGCCPEEHWDYTASCFTFSSGPALLVSAHLRSSDEATREHFVVDEQLRRIEVPLRASTIPSTLTLTMEVDLDQFPGTPDRVEVGFAFLTIEEGAFASSPIPPENVQRIRGGDQLHHSRIESWLAGEWGTLVMNFVPLWSGFQLQRGVPLYLLDCESEDQRSRISILAEYSDSGRLKAVVRCDGEDHVIVSDIIPVRNKTYSVAFRWAGRIADFVINGRNVAGSSGIELPSDVEIGRNVYIASTARSDRNSAFVLLCHHEMHGSWLSDQQIRARLFELDPNSFGRYRGEWEFATRYQELQFLRSTDSVMPLVRLLLSLPNLWQCSPPVWLNRASLDEAHCRDEIHRALVTNGIGATPESHSATGRTDLLVELIAGNTTRVRVEFKVWGRHDYRQVPQKPLKYFTTGERLGVVVMLNPNRAKSIAMDYRNNVRASDTCVFEIVDLPFESECFPDHFLSLHRSETGSIAEVLHIVFDQYGPFEVEKANGEG